MRSNKIFNWLKNKYKGMITFSKHTELGLDFYIQARAKYACGRRYKTPDGILLTTQYIGSITRYSEEKNYVYCDDMVHAQFVDTGTIVKNLLIPQLNLDIFPSDPQRQEYLYRTKSPNNKIEMCHIVEDTGLDSIYKMIHKSNIQLRNMNN